MIRFSYFQSKQLKFIKNKIQRVSTKENPIEILEELRKAQQNNLTESEDDYYVSSDRPFIVLMYAILIVVSIVLFFSLFYQLK